MYKLTSSRETKFSDSVRAQADKIGALAANPLGVYGPSDDGVRWLKTALLGIVKILRGANDDYEASAPTFVQPWTGNPSEDDVEQYRSGGAAFSGWEPDTGGPESAPDHRGDGDPRYS